MKLTWVESVDGYIPPAMMGEDVLLLETQSGTHLIVTETNFEGGSCACCGLSHNAVKRVAVLDQDAVIALILAAGDK